MVVTSPEVLKKIKLRPEDISSFQFIYFKPKNLRLHY